MFKKLSLSLHKSQKADSTNFHNTYPEASQRDSLVDPHAVDMSTTGYSRNTYIDPTMSSFAAEKPLGGYDNNSSTAQYHYTNDSYDSYYETDSNNDLKPPPLEINHHNNERHSQTYPSPASIPSPITPGNVHHKTAAMNPREQSDNEVEALVHEGITFHEKGQLEKATSLFRIAAEKENPLGMFLYGVSLRHGWGCKKNEHLAFQYLQKAAEHAVEDLANITNTVNTSASKGELIMAIYELGVSFRHGWGCKKNKESAVQFFKIAADLGDPDAQNDLGHCYYNGQGVKKDLYLAAKYYRKADKQGQGIMGNSWIWKSKYDHPK